MHAPHRYLAYSREIKTRPQVRRPVVVLSRFLRARYSRTSGFGWTISGSKMQFAAIPLPYEKHPQKSKCDRSNAKLNHGSAHVVATVSFCAVSRLATLACQPSAVPTQQSPVNSTCSVGPGGLAGTAPIQENRTTPGSPRRVWRLTRDRFRRLRRDTFIPSRSMSLRSLSSRFEVARPGVWLRPGSTNRQRLGH